MELSNQMIKEILRPEVALIAFGLIGLFFLLMMDRDDD